MKIAVCIKRVPDTASVIKLNNDATGIVEDGLKWVISPYDEFALEEALKCKEAKENSEVTVITVGSAKSQDVLRSALAMGADKAIIIDGKASGIDAAQLLAAKIKAENFDIVFMGKHAVDDDAGQVSHMTAQLLDWPHVSSVSKFELSEDTKKATVNRDVDGGNVEVWDIELPAVFAATKGLNQPRFASLKGIMKAKSKPIETLSSQDLSLDTMSNVKSLGYELPPQRPEGKMFKENPDQAITDVVRLLREEAKVI